MPKNLWSREELILAFNLYLKIPFGKISYRSPEVIYLAELIGRSPNAAAIRLANFASVDPFIKIVVSKEWMVVETKSNQFGMISSTIRKHWYF